MTGFHLVLLGVGVGVGVGVVIAVSQNLRNTQASSPRNLLSPDQDSRVERLEKLVQKPSLNIEQMQITGENTAVNYDYENEFSIMRFYLLEPFSGKLKECVVIRQADTKTEGVTCRLVIERDHDGKKFIVDNFKTFPGSKAKLEELVKQNTCNLPHDIWLLRHSASYSPTAKVRAGTLFPF